MDIVDKLRHHDKGPSVIGKLRNAADYLSHTLAESADEIDHLRAKVEALKSALVYARERLSNLDDLDAVETLTDMRLIDDALREGE